MFFPVFWVEGGLGAVITSWGSGLAQQSVVPAAGPDMARTAGKTDHVS